MNIVKVKWCYVYARCSDAAGLPRLTAFYYTNAFNSLHPEQNSVRLRIPPDLAFDVSTPASVQQSL